MGRSGVITFKGNPMTLEGDDLSVGSPAPAFTLHYADGGLQTLTLDDLKGKPTIISVVPSLDTPTRSAVCSGKILRSRGHQDADRQRLPDA